MLRRGYDLNILNPVCLPVIPGCDVVGYIIAKGSKVYGYEEGDHVAALLQHGGGNARYISIASSQLIKIPKYDHQKMMKKQQKSNHTTNGGDGSSKGISNMGTGIINQIQYKNIDSAEAVAMTTVYATAYQVLKKIQQNGPLFTLQDKKVLIYMGYHGPILSDPIGYALIQMCHKARASIYVVIHHKHKYSYYKNRMKVMPLPYEEQDQWKALIQHKMDYVLDGYCENGLQTSYTFLKKDLGELICYGSTSMFHNKSANDNNEMGLLGAPLYSGHINQLYATNCYPKDRVKFVYRTSSIYESYMNDPIIYQKNVKSLFQLLLLHKIKPKISYQISLNEVPWAQQQFESSSVTTAEQQQETTYDDAYYEKHEGGIVVCLPWMKKHQDKTTNRKKTNKEKKSMIISEIVPPKANNNTEQSKLNNNKSAKKKVDIDNKNITNEPTIMKSADAGTTTNIVVDNQQQNEPLLIPSHVGGSLISSPQNQHHEIQTQTSYQNNTTTTSTSIAWPCCYGQ